MSTPTRIYHVHDGQKEHLVRTTIPSRAISFVAEQAFSCRVATQDDLERLLPSHKVHKVGAEADQKPAQTGSNEPEPKDQPQTQTTLRILPTEEPDTVAV